MVRTVWRTSVKGASPQVVTFSSRISVFPSRARSPLRRHTSHLELSTNECCLSLLHCLFVLNAQRSRAVSPSRRCAVMNPGEVNSRRLRCSLPLCLPPLSISLSLCPFITLATGRNARLQSSGYQIYLRAEVGASPLPQMQGEEKGAANTLPLAGPSIMGWVF